MNVLTNEIEKELREHCGKWTETERLLFAEIDRLRAELKEEQEGRMNFVLQYANQLNSDIDY